MEKFRVEKIRENAQTSNSYFALRSPNELYYQMASIFKEVTIDENKMTQKILSSFLTQSHPEIVLENFL
ncbi:hypothetical protein [Desulfobacula sp.]